MKILKYLGIKPKPKPKKEVEGTLSKKYANEVWARNGNLLNLKTIINGNENKK